MGCSIYKQLKQTFKNLFCCIIFTPYILCKHRVVFYHSIFLYFFFLIAQFSDRRQRSGFQNFLLALSKPHPPVLNTLSFCMYYQPFLLLQPFDIRSKPKESYKWSPRRKRRHLLKGSDIYWAITGAITVPFRVMTKSPLNTHINSLSLAEQLRIEGDLFFLPTFSIITISILLFSRDRSFSDTFVCGILLLMYCFWRIQIVALPLVTNCRVGQPSSLRFRYTLPSPCLIFLSLKSYFPRGFVFIDSRALWDLLDWLGHWYKSTFTRTICLSELIGL